MFHNNENWRRYTHNNLPPGKTVGEHVPSFLFSLWYAGVKCPHQISLEGDRRHSLGSSDAPPSPRRGFRSAPLVPHQTGWQNSEEDENSGSRTGGMDGTPASESGISFTEHWGTCLVHLLEP